MAQFELSERQTQAILSMPLQRLTVLEREKIEAEYKELVSFIEDLRGILASEERQLQIIKDEVEEVTERFGDERRTEIVYAAEEFDIEDLIAEEDMVVVLSHLGYVKRVPLTSYRKQKRGGRGIKGAGTKEKDFVEHLFVASTHYYIFFFTDRGRVHRMKVYDLPQLERVARSRPRTGGC